ncbi:MULTISPECIES: distal tail protein Dit [unclassified Sutcliffiella]|uniref:distal tail protein Dit n=1 Tax=unclassified Sutcliffiella TaxID=2837532 RepID=UPI0030CBAE20
MYTFAFNGIKKSYLYCEPGKRRSIIAPLNRVLVSLPGMPGAHHSDTEVEVRIIDQPFFIKARDKEELRKMEENMANWLVTKEAKPLIFDDEPDRIYYAMIQGGIDVGDVGKEFGRGTITFLCADPFKYGSQLTFKKNASTEDTNTLAIANPGTVEAYPEFKFTVKKSITHLDIINRDAYMRIGRPVTVEDTIIQPRETILSDAMNTLVGWSNASQVDGGVVAGSFMVGSDGFQVNSFGSGEAWHGPSLQKSISQPLRNFQVEMRCKFFSMSPVGVGRIELYLLDANGNKFAKLAFKDIHRYNYLQQGEVRVGPHVGGTFIIAGTPPDPKQWDYFTGILRLSRINGKWEAYIANIDGVHIGVMEATYIDESVNADLTGIQIHAGVSGTNSPATMRIQQIRVYKLNDVSGSVVPYIAQPGDEIIIDHKSDSILINGQDMKKLKGDFISSYFPINPGDNALVISPGDAVDIEAKVRGAYH